MASDLALHAMSRVGKAVWLLAVTRHTNMLVDLDDFSSKE